MQLKFKILCAFKISVGRLTYRRLDIRTAAASQFRSLQFTLNYILHTRAITRNLTHELSPRSRNVHAKHKFTFARVLNSTVLCNLARFLNL